MIVIWADGNQEIGLGHLMRCIGIYLELKKYCEVFFVVSEDTDSDVLENYGINYIKMKNASGVLKWNCEEFIDIIRNISANLVLLDSYRVDFGTFEQIKKVAKLVYIDDLYLFDYNADVVINYNVEATKERYMNTQYLSRKLFLGPKYFPLRSELRDIEKKELKKKLGTVLITTGSTDSMDILWNLLNAIEPYTYTEIQFNIILGKLYSEKYVLKVKELCHNWKNVHLLPWGQNMGLLYSITDLVLAPGSTTIFEALSLGIPSISYEFVENHHFECIYLEKLNCVPYAGAYQKDVEFTNENIGRLFRRLLSFEERKSRQEIFSRLFDGKGVKRITDVIIGELR